MKKKNKKCMLFLLVIMAISMVLGSIPVFGLGVAEEVRAVNEQKLENLGSPLTEKIPLEKEAPKIPLEGNLRGDLELDIPNPLPPVKAEIPVNEDGRIVPKKEVHLVSGELNLWEVKISIPFCWTSTSPTTTPSVLLTLKDSYSNLFNLVGVPAINYGTVSFDAATRTITASTDFRSLTLSENDITQNNGKNCISIEMTYRLKLDPAGPFRESITGDKMFNFIIPLDTKNWTLQAQPIINQRPIATNPQGFEQPQVMPAGVRVFNTLSEPIVAEIWDMSTPQGEIIYSHEVPAKSDFIFDGGFKSNTHYKMVSYTKNGNLLTENELRKDPPFNKQSWETAEDFQLLPNEAHLAECIASWDSLAAIFVNRKTNDPYDPQHPDVIHIRYFEKNEKGEYVLTEEKTVTRGTEEHLISPKISKDDNHLNFTHWEDLKHSPGTKLFPENVKMITDNTDFYAQYEEAIKACFWEKNAKGEWVKTKCIDVTPGTPFPIPDPDDPAYHCTFWNKKNDPTHIEFKSEAEIKENTDFYCNYDPIKACFWEKNAKGEWVKTKCVDVPSRGGDIVIPDPDNPAKKCVYWNEKDKTDRIDFKNSQHISKSTDFYCNYESIKACFWEKNAKGEWTKTKCVDVTPGNPFPLPDPDNPAYSCVSWNKEKDTSTLGFKSQVEISENTNFYCNYNPPKACFWEKNAKGEWVKTKCIDAPVGGGDIKIPDPNNPAKKCVYWNEKDKTDRVNFTDTKRISENTDFYCNYEKPIRVCFWEKNSFGEYENKGCLDTPDGRFVFPDKKNPDFEKQVFTYWGDAISPSKTFNEKENYQVSTDSNFYAQYLIPKTEIKVIVRFVTPPGVAIPSSVKVVVNDHTYTYSNENNWRNVIGVPSLDQVFYSADMLPDFTRDIFDTIKENGTLEIVYTAKVITAPPTVQLPATGEKRNPAAQIGICLLIVALGLSAVALKLTRKNKKEEKPSLKETPKENDKEKDENNQ